MVPIGALKADEIAAIVFVDVALIIVVARVVGALFKKIRQPAVVGEILAGIVLGPTLLGAFPGDLPDKIFPEDVRPFLNILAQVGLVIFMFIVGMELDLKLIHGKERIAAVISLCSIALPFVLGILLATTLHGSHDEAEQAGDFVPFALFIGASMSITAFPVLARILTERRMYRTEIGALTLACAAVDDILAWSLLAVVLAIVASTSLLDLPRILFLSILFVAFMFVVVKPRLRILADKYREAGRLTPNILAVILVGFLTSAWITSEIGIHQIFGAFLFGVIMPRQDTAEFFHEILERLEQATVILLLPVFFIVTGLNVDVRGLGSEAFTQLPLILLTAVAGKLVGASAAARAQGLQWRKAGAVGVLMNTRGLTELVILNVGLEFGVLDSRLFTMLVVMAIVTTVMTEPLLRLVYPDRVLARDIADAEKAALGVVDAYRVLVVVGDSTAEAQELVDAAVDIVGDEEPAEVVLTRFRPLATQLEVASGLGAELGEVAASAEQLRELARRAEERGVGTAVRAQFSDDIPRDLLVQAEAVEADVLLLGSGTEWLPPDQREGFHPALIRDAPCVVSVLRDPAGRGIEVGAGHPVVATTAEGVDSAAVVELAVRMARSRHAPILLVPVDGTRKNARRTSEWARRLRSLALESPDWAATPDERRRQLGDAAVLAVPAGRDGSAGEGDAAADVAVEAPVLTVRAARDDDGRNLELLLERLEKAGEGRRTGSAASVHSGGGGGEEPGGQGSSGV